MNKITRIDENFDIDDHLKWVREFLGMKPGKSFQDLDVDVGDDDNENEEKTDKINLWRYQEAKKIKITDINDQEFVGNVVDVTDAEENMDDSVKEDAITVSVNKAHIEFMQSEIKSIEALE